MKSVTENNESNKDQQVSLKLIGGKMIKVETLSWIVAIRNRHFNDGQSVPEPVIGRYK